ncbi:MAG: SDR family NAD(P)-dependent oxidoreductase [Candidatus Riflebacteria bacterium]|nr:SDR family NAD(P)-dependent oxidoreductase [Candidatus Riflebacteria bacterium]
MKLKNKTIILVGASKGIGRELAFQLAERGNSLILFSRHIKSLQDDPRYKQLPHPPRLFPGDVKNQADIDFLAAQIGDSEQLDGVIYCAGVSRPDFVESPEIERAVDTIQVNLEGAIRVIYRFLPKLMACPGSFIAGFTSMAGDRGMPRGHTYSASKAGFDRFLDSLRIDLLDKRINVFTIIPGYVESPMSDQNKFPMPGRWPAPKAASFLINQLEKECLIIRFPWYHALGMAIMGLIPNFLYWRIMNQNSREVKIIPQSDDHYKW